MVWISSRSVLRSNAALPFLLAGIFLTNVAFAQQKEDASQRIASETFTDRPQTLVPRQLRTESDNDQLRSATLFMEARIKEGRDELVPALRRYQRAWRYQRKAKTILKQIVPLAIKLGRVDEATRYALLLTDSDLEDPFLAERLAMLMADQVEYDRSLQLYRHVLQLRSEEFEVRNPVAMHFEMGRLYFLTKQYEQAAQSFHVVLDSIDNPKKHQLDKDVRDAILSEPNRLYTLFAESFLEAGEYDEAKELFERAAETEQAAGWLQFHLARVDYRAGRYEAAKEKLEEYVQQKLKLGGRTPYEILQTLQEKMSVKEPPNETEDEDKAVNSGVIASFRDWLTDDPDNFPLLSYVADLTSRKGGLKDAVKLYEKSVATRPTLEGYLGLFKTYRQLKDTESLLELLAKTSLELKSLDFFEDEIQLLVKDRELLDSVFELARKKIEKQPDQLGNSLAGGLLALKVEQFDLADDFFSNIPKTPEQFDVLVAWGMQSMVSDNNAKAVEVFQATLDAGAAKGNESVLLFYLAGALQLEGKTEDALRLARRAAQLAADVPDITLRPAWILYNANRTDEAYSEYDAWLSKHAEDYSVPGTRESVRDARFVMSNICLEQNKTDEAIEWLEQILDEFPSDVGALNDLGYLLVDKKRSVDRATAMIRMAVDAEPDNVAYRDSLGWALYRSGKYEEAVLELQKASSVEQPDPIILDHLGDAFDANGNTSDARTAWERAISLLEEDEELKQSIKRKLARETVESK